MDQLIDTFKILADETRLRMMVLLYQEDLCVCQLSGILGVPQPRISQNLSKLRDLRLVMDERKEKYVFYSLKKENETLVKILGDIFDDLDSYARLAADRSGLGDKDKYLSQCCVTGDTSK